MAEFYNKHQDLKAGRLCSCRPVYSDLNAQYSYFAVYPNNKRPLLLITAFFSFTIFNKIYIVVALAGQMH